MAIFDGTAGNDLFLFNATPNPGGDLFRMGDGNDLAFANSGPNSYFGGNGIDAVSYRFADAGVTLSLALGGTGGFADGHSYNSIEKIFGSNFNDNITGSLGADFLYGGLGNDILNGNDGNDRLFGQDGNDTINGGIGNDYIEGGAGSDVINGGIGTDTIGFSTATEGVTVDLDAPPPQSEPLPGTLQMDAQGDIYVSIENISGSAFDDTLRGDSGANVINGRSGNDFIVGDGGNDRLIGGLGDDFLGGGDGSDYLHGGTGNDTLIGGNGNDRIYLGNGEDEAQGGNGNDFFYLTNDGDPDAVYGGNNTNGDGPNTDTGYDTVSYIQATAGVEVFLGDLLIFRPPEEPSAPKNSEENLNMAVAEPDLLSGIERVIGSNFDDAIFGGFENETLFGGNGDDILSGGAGRDRLIGGDGADTFEFNTSFSDVDSILDFEQGVDTIVFFSSDPNLTEADVLATLVDYGTHFVFEFGFAIDGPPVEQRLAVIKNDPDFILTVDDFTIEFFDPGPPLLTQEPIMDGIFDQSLAEQDMVSMGFDALI